MYKTPSEDVFSRDTIHLLTIGEIPQTGSALFVAVREEWLQHLGL